MAANHYGSLLRLAMVVKLHDHSQVFHLLFCLCQPLAVNSVSSNGLTFHWSTSQNDSPQKHYNLTKKVFVWVPKGNQRSPFLLVRNIILWKVISNIYIYINKHVQPRKSWLIANASVCYMRSNVHSRLRQAAERPTRFCISLKPWACAPYIYT